MTKKWARVLLTSLLTAALFTGCSSAPAESKPEEGTQTEAGTNETNGEKVKVSLLVTNRYETSSRTA